MATYGVAAAQAGLPSLIDRAVAGEEVIITRHGKPVMEIRRIAAASPLAGPAFYGWLESRRSIVAGPPMTSVELLDLIYDNPGS
jgi:antitoxin (DNA-binding transcriptional repressor) of toxin-antitoxin stability system